MKYQALIQAINDNNLAEIIRLLEEIATPAARTKYINKSKDDHSISKEIHYNGPTSLNLLHRAAQQGRVAIVEYLIEAGGDINTECLDAHAEPMSGTTPLYYAIKHAHISTMEVLFKHGATLSDAAFFTAINLSYNPFTIVEYLLKIQSTHDATRFCLQVRLLIAAYQGDKQTIVQWLQINPIASLRTKDWINPLIGAVLANNIDMVQFLLATGITITEELIAQHGTALIYAAEQGYAELVKYFVETAEAVGKEEEMVNAISLSTQRTALMCAAEKNEVEIISYLLQHHANPKKKDKPGEQTALSLAASAGNLAAVKCLIEEADYQPGEQLEKIALNKAIKTGHLETADYLIEVIAKHADIDSNVLLTKAIDSGNFELATHYIDKEYPALIQNQESLLTLTKRMILSEAIRINIYAKISQNKTISHQEIIALTKAQIAEYQQKLLYYFLEKQAISLTALIEMANFTSAQCNNFQELLAGMLQAQTGIYINLIFPETLTEYLAKEPVKDQNIFIHCKIGDAFIKEDTPGFEKAIIINPDNPQAFEKILALPDSRIQDKTVKILQTLIQAAEKDEQSASHPLAFYQMLIKHWCKKTLVNNCLYTLFAHKAVISVTSIPEEISERAILFGIDREFVSTIPRVHLP